MNFLADENFPQKSVQLLRESNFDVKSIGLDLPGVTDEEVLEYATQEERTILTFDRMTGS